MGLKPEKMLTTAIRWMLWAVVALFLGAIAVALILLVLMAFGAFPFSTCGPNECV
jgi:hypothetical protein